MKVEKWIDKKIGPKNVIKIKEAMKDIAKHSFMVLTNNALGAFLEGKGFSIEKCAGGVKDEIINGTINKIVGFGAKKMTKAQEEMMKQLYNDKMQKSKYFHNFVNFMNDEKNSEFKNEFITKARKVANSMNEEIIKGYARDKLYDVHRSVELLKHLYCCNNFQRLLKDDGMMELSPMESNIIIDKYLPKPKYLKSLAKNIGKEFIHKDFLYQMN